MAPDKKYSKIIFAVYVITLISFTVFTAPTALQSVKRDFLVVIDPGHGGMDGGAVGILSHAKESDLNLAVSVLLVEELRQMGIRSVLTRKDSGGLYDGTQKGFKRQDMEKRKSIICSLSPAVVVSIHMNKFSLPSRRGAQVCHQSGDGISQTFANVLQSKLNSAINSDIGKEFAPISGDYFVTRISPCPAVIVECGFLSNPDDDALLNTASHQRKLAHAIADGIVNFWFVA